MTTAQWGAWETWETNTEIGPRILDAWDGEGSVFVVVRSYEVYKELERLNGGSSMCRWLSASPPSQATSQQPHQEDGDDDYDDDARSVSTAVTDAASPDIGVIRLGAPRFSYEKAKAGLPACFLFGRRCSKRTADIHLGRSSKTSVSRFHFALGLKNGNWAVRHIGRFKTVVDTDTPLNRTTPSLALRPGRCHVIRVADIDLELYCRDIAVAATFLMDNTSLPLEHPRAGTDPSGTTSLTTAPGPPPTDVPAQLKDRLYVLEEQVFPGRTDVVKCLAMDGWTCARYVVKLYPYSSTQYDALRTRIALLDPLPLDSPFIRDQFVREFESRLGLFARYHEDTFPLEEITHLATPQSARKLLRAVLKIVARLHQFNIVHNDICVSTLFVAGVFEPDSVLDNIFLSGFSEATGDMTRAKDDCFQVFRTIQDFLGQRSVLPKFWTGDAQLDRLWQHLVEHGNDSWPCTVQEICHLSDINLSLDTQEPKTISVSKGFCFRHTSEQDVSYLDAGDVKEYLSKDAVRCAGKVPSPSQVQRLAQTAFAALEPCIFDGRITAEDYSCFRHHMNERHSNFNMGARLFMSLPNKYYIKRPIQFNLSFPVPFLSRYALINLEYLCHLATTSSGAETLKHLLPYCYEVRGFPEARGVYIPVTHLDAIAERLGLRVEDNDYNPSTVEGDLLDGFTYQEWYLLAPNPMSPLFPVSRASGQVLTTISPPAFTPFRTFLEDHIEAKTFLDSQVVHDPEKLFSSSSAAAEQGQPPSCGGSVEAPSTAGVPFRFSSLPKPSLLLEAKEKRKAETVSWLKGQEEGRGRAKRGKARVEGLLPGMSPRGHIVPTKFVSRS